MARQVSLGVTTTTPPLELLEVSVARQVSLGVTTTTPPLEPREEWVRRVSPDVIITIRALAHQELWVVDCEAPVISTTTLVVDMITLLVLEQVENTAQNS